MRRLFVHGIACITLSCLSLGAIAQQLKIESQGQAEQESLKASAVAKGMAKAVGQPGMGMGQVVFFRSSKSPGTAIDVTADGGVEGRLEAGMYIAVPATPGTHHYGPGMLPVVVKAGETRYMQVIRDRAGDPRMLASSATRFQAAARQSK